MGGINAPSTSSISCMSIVLSFIFLLSSGCLLYTSSIGAYRVPAPKPTEASRNTTESLNYILENTLSYNQSFLNNAHNFQVLLGQSYQKEEYEGLKVVASGFTDDSIENLSLIHISRREYTPLTICFHYIENNIPYFTQIIFSFPFLQVQDFLDNLPLCFFLSLIHIFGCGLMTL